MFPEKIEIREKKLLFITWQDGGITQIRLVNLRRACPCALCNADRESQGPDYIPLYNDDEITITNIKVMGYYGINVEWKDGHNTGIYEFNHLKKISQTNS